MKKIVLSVFVLLFGLLSFGCAAKDLPVMEDAEQANESNEAAVRSLVETFGSKLQLVSLLAPDVRESMEKNYGDYVTPSLLEKWQNDPENAPGRLTSSPWPDRIEILSVERETADTYQVTGNIVEVTSAEQSGGAASKRPITLEVKRIGNRWFIDDVTLGTAAATGAVTYENTTYGFTFALPESWKGYTIVTGQWDGASLAEGQTGKIVASGPQLSIRHPEWTKENPRQDIPIMIFTIQQWDAMKSGKFHIGAAPIDPSELGRNSAYVFALPARYNFAFPTGYEEVEDILKGNPLKPNENFAKASSSPASSSAK